MNVVGHGIDLVSCPRLADMVERHGQRFLDRVFTSSEQEYCLGRKRQAEHLAGRFAAKEAVMKVFGTGWGKGISWTDIEVRNTASGQPQVHLAGPCRRIAEEMGLTRILISISHTAEHAIASALGVSA